MKGWSERISVYGSYNTFKNQKWDERQIIYQWRNKIEGTILLKTNSGMKVMELLMSIALSMYNNFKNQKWDES